LRLLFLFAKRFIAGMDIHDSPEIFKMPSIHPMMLVSICHMEKNGCPIRSGDLKEFKNIRFVAKNLIKEK